jgi:hypothetical protein
VEEEEEECKTSWRPVPLLLHSTDPGAPAPSFEIMAPWMIDERGVR